MKHFRMALRFLTRYPVSQDEEYEKGDFGKSSGYFPLVGFLAGLDLLLLRWLMLQDDNGLHYPLWCFLLLLFWVWSSDSLHLDGLADTADALASRKQGNDFMEVLHDSRTGAFGVVALVLALLAKFAWLTALPMRFLWFLPLPLLFSRLHASLCCQVRPYGGSPGSLSSLMVTEARHSDFNRALAWAVACLLTLSLPSIYFGMATVAETVLAFLVCCAGLLLGSLIVRLPMSRLGGISGDMIGWSLVITETAIAFGLTLVLL